MQNWVGHEDQANQEPWVVPREVWRVQYSGAAVQGFCYSVSGTRSAAQGKQEREARALLYAAKGNFDFFSPGAELILAILRDRRLSDMMVPNPRLCCVAYSNKYRVWGQDTASSPL